MRTQSPTLSKPPFLLLAVLFLGGGGEALASLCNQPQLLGVVRTACKKGERQGASAISCFRSQAHQDRLRRQFCNQGRCGQAAKRSMHTLGAACDMSRAVNMSPLRRLNSASHSGHHYSTTGR